MEEGDELEEDLARTRGSIKRQQRHGASHIPESRRSRKPRISESRRTSNVRKESYEKLLKEYKELKTKNGEYKEALKVFKTKINEVALFNQNLAHVTKLFTEHSTTKKEKMAILERFDEIETIKESKSLYKTIAAELTEKSPITEAVTRLVYVLYHPCNRLVFFFQAALLQTFVVQFYMLKQLIGKLKKNSLVFTSVSFSCAFVFTKSAILRSKVFSLCFSYILIRT